MNVPDRRGANWVQVFAPAKVNLTLHVTGQRADGYHTLDSLVVFADVGDLLHVAVGNTLSLTIEGAEAAQVPTDTSNLIMQVAALFQDMPGAAFLLEKSLPVSSGIGGGSADAAAAFRGLMTQWSGGEVDSQMFDPARTPMAGRLLALGADIPVCLRNRPARMQGAGETLNPLPAMPDLHAVLVNPRIGVSTPQVFRALDHKENPAMPPELPKFSGLHQCIEWLATQRNDLQEPAITLVPEIAQVLDVLGATKSCLLARMSGSGATCFGLFTGQHAAKTAAADIADQHPGWWVKPARLGDMSQRSLPRVN